ncbi:MAG: hypothetical protein ACAI35_10885 [Candidatus Methylacidiphilales bacterium]|nr:hypothetical protein [Candidatus Methylacidiphilales bacterium]
MVAVLWKVFLEYIWPYLWPLIRDRLIKKILDAVEELVKLILLLFRKRNMENKEYAEAKEAEARQNAANATSPETKAAAEASASAWQEIREKLERENSKLLEELQKLKEKIMKDSIASASSQEESERMRKSIWALPPPSLSDIEKPKDPESTAS